MTFNGSEIINNRRAAVYAGSGGISMRCSGSCDVNLALDDPAYTFAADTPPAGAEWYDPAVPESTRFWGVAGLNVIGLSKAPGKRVPTALVRDGSAIGPYVVDDREVTFRVLLLGADDCAVSYGLAWLTSALKGSPCAPGSCGGSTMCVMTCCPHCEEGDTACGLTHMRTLFDVGLLEGPSLIGQSRVNGGTLWTVDFTMTCGRPFIYRQPVGASVTVPAAQRTVQLNPTLISVNASDLDLGCTELASCLADPLCPDPAMPPQPPALVDPCWPTKPEKMLRRIYSIAPLKAPEWLETVPVVSIYAGSGPMRTTTVRFYANPLGLDCSTYLNELCSACDSMSVLYIPAASTLVLDGRTQRASVDCPGGTGRVTAEPKLYGPNGGLFSWPVFSCGVGLCVEVMSSAANTAQDNTVSVVLYPREDAC